MKENFDDILRKKWEEKQFPVDQSHRADMIRLLDQNNRRRTGFLWWFFGVGVACALIALFVILNDADRLNDAVKPVDSVNTIDAQAMLRPANPQPGATAQQPAEKGLEEKTEMQGHSEDKYTTQAKETDSFDTNDEQETQASGNKLKDGKAGIVDENEAGSRGNEDSNRKSKAEEINKVDVKPNVNKSNTITKAANKKKEQTIASTNEIYKPGYEKKDLNTNPSNHSDNSIISNSAETKEAVVPVVTPNEVEATTNPVDNTNENTTLVVRNDLVTNPIDALAFGNIDFTVDNEIGNVEPVIVKRDPVWLYAEAGMGFVPTPKSNIKSGYTLRAGGGVGYGLSAKNSLTLSGGYLVQKNGFDFQRSSTVEQSGFGTRSNFNTLTPDKLHFVYARLGLHHRIKRHMISVFGGGQYLYGAQGFVLVKSDDQLTGVSEKTKYAWLKIDGMNRLWWNAELNYGYQITPRFSIQAGVKYNFTSIVATDQALKDEGYHWKGDLSSLSPSFTINYHLYGKR